MLSKDKDINNDDELKLLFILIHCETIEKVSIKTLINYFKIGGQIMIWNSYVILVNMVASFTIDYCKFFNYKKYFIVKIIFIIIIYVYRSLQYEKVFAKLWQSTWVSRIIPIRLHYSSLRAPVAIR